MLGGLRYGLDGGCFLWGSMFGKGKAYPELGGERGMGQGWYGAIGKLALDRGQDGGQLSGMEAIAQALQLAAEHGLVECRVVRD